MINLPDNILHLPEYQVMGVKQEEYDLHFQIDAPHPIACEECGVEGEFVRFGKRDVAYHDLQHGSARGREELRRRSVDLSTFWKD